MNTLQLLNQVETSLVMLLSYLGKLNFSVIKWSSLMTKSYFQLLKCFMIKTDLGEKGIIDPKRRSDYQMEQKEKNIAI